VVKVNEKLSSVSSAFDLEKALFDEAIPCGISSLLVQVTAVPAFTVNVGGLKVKLSIEMLPAGAALCARAGSTIGARMAAATAPRAAATRAPRIVSKTDITGPISLGALCR
jgi:hypothetical protein